MIDNTITSKGVTYTFPLPETAAQMVEYLGEKRAYGVTGVVTGVYVGRE